MKKEIKTFIPKVARWTTALACVLAVASCTKDFEDINKNPLGVTDEDLEADYNYIGMKFKQPQTSIYFATPGEAVSKWQVMHNLSADIYSGYMMSPGFAISNANYALKDGWNNACWQHMYTQVMAPVKNIIEICDKDGFPDYKAAALIIKVAAMHQVTEKYGPIVYTQYGKGGGSSAYDTEKVVWESMVADLNTACESLSKFINDPANEKLQSRFAKFDVLLGGKYPNWLKFGNSLRLRLAIRLSKVDPALAQKTAEAAVASGVLETGDPLVRCAAIAIWNPLYEVSRTYNDIKMGASMESILKGYKDSRMEKMWEPSKYDGTYRGIPNGADQESKARYENFSNPRIASLQSSESPNPIIYPAEVYFLRAEGALRGWAMGGDAQALYEQGIRESFTQWGAGGASDYIMNAVSVAAPYVDPTATKDDPAKTFDKDQRLNNVTIAWDEAASNEQKLAKIITQKWIACFPLGQEAWSEYRRTGYPTLFPVSFNQTSSPSDAKLIGVTDYTNGVLNADAANKVQIRRLCIPLQEKQNNTAEANKAITYIKGGQDLPSAQLYWDTNNGTSNF